MKYPVFPCGDHAVTLQVGSEISEKVNGEVMAVLKALRRADIPGITELVPTYNTLCIHYDPMLLSYTALQKKLMDIPVDLAENTAQQTHRVVEIPVCYGGEYGPDLNFVAEHNGLTVQQVIDLHTRGNYLVYMMGFLPGFAYLGGLDARIACPRLTSPRTKIPAGSVGIAGSQTGIYPLASPGGWQLIGRTPMKLFEMKDGQAQFALSAGDRVRFVPISEEQYREMEGIV